MYLIAGLGNPEPKYSMTRHNMGFDVINGLAKKYNIDVNKNGFKSLYGKGEIEGKSVILCKPQTYMNLSGDAISELINFYKIDNKDFIMVYDDMDIETGKIKIRKKGSSGGHNGVKSVIANLGTEEIQRIRIGIGSPEDRTNLVDYVTKKVTMEEYKKLRDGINIGIEALCELLKVGIDSTMNEFN